MNDEKIVALVKKIDEKSIAGRVDWEKTVSDEEFQASLPSFVIRVRREYHNSPEPDYVISLVDRNGTELESFDDSYVSRILKGIYSNENGYIYMERIFKSAKRRALGVDRAIDSIIDELG